MNELERELKKDDGIENQLKALIQEVQRLREENHEMHQKIDRIEDQLETTEVYDTSDKNNYLTNKPDAVVKEFKSRVKSGMDGIDVTTISSLFNVKPRQAYNVKDRIVSEEPWLAEIPKSNGKNRIVSKRAYLQRLVARDYPEVPDKVNREEGKDFDDLTWRTLYTVYSNNAEGKPEKEDKLDKIEDWFDM